MTGSVESLPAVTIGIPFCEQPVGQLEAAVRSVFAQSHSRWELILVADGASRECLDLARMINDPRVHLEVFTERGGLARRLNDITALAETPFLFRMDGDDVMHPERVASQLRILHSGITDLVASRAYLIDNSDTIYGLMKEPPTAPLEFRDFLGRGVFTHPTVAARTDWFRANPYDVDLLRAEDKALYISAARSSRMLKLPEPLLFYRVARPISPSRQSRDSKFDRIATQKYGHLVATKGTILGYTAVSSVKAAAFRAMSNKLGRDYLFERKIDRLESVALDIAKALLDTVLTCSVPGWPDPISIT